MSHAYRTSVAAPLAALLLLTTPGAASAGGEPQATISVDTLVDVVAEDGVCSLREAILNAEGNDQSGSTDCDPGVGSPDEIVFDASLSGGTIMLNGEAMPTITEALHITGPLADDPTGMTLDADGASRILVMQTAVELSHLTLTGGHTTSSGGGGIFSNADLSLTHVALVGNATEGDNVRGGGLAVLGGDVTLTDSIVFGNSTAGAGSGGGGLFVQDGDLTLIHTMVLDNTTAGANADGGGLAKLGGGAVELTDCTVSGNMTLAAGARGAGLFVNLTDQYTALLERSTVSGNSAGGSGGGLDFTGATIDVDFRLVNSTVSGNTSGGNGGGMFTTGNVTALHTTFAFNTAEVNGDGIFRVVTVMPLLLRNSLIVQGGGGEVACNVSATLGFGSLATDGSCGTEVATLQEIALVELAENGGLTQTHALDTGSVAIDQADDAICGELAPQQDQRGVSRPLDGDGDGSSEDLNGGCDVGAYEAAAAQTPVLAFAPASFDFGDVPVGDPAEKTMTLDNLGGADATGLDFSGLPDMGFEADTDGCGTTLPAGASCTFVVTFTPAQLGTASAALQVSSAEDSTATLALTGNGLAAVFAAHALEVDPVGLTPGANGLFEPGESVDVAPAWRNDGNLAASLTGQASSFTGPDGATYSIDLDVADYGLIEPGAIAGCLDTEVCYRLGLDDPAARPVTHWDATFDETVDDPDGTVKTWTLHIGDSFADVPRGSLFYPWIETLLHNSVTGGCTSTTYCPAAANTRDQMPVFLLKALEGSAYVPPACTGVFDDVPCPSLFANWIEDLAGRGVTAGCGGGNYCPGNPVNRDQMAVFLLKTLLGPGYTPPACTGVFGDVPCPSLFANWIEDLVAREIAAGCGGGNYCPANPVSRDQMAVFLTKTFELTLYGP